HLLERRQSILGPTRLDTLNSMRCLAWTDAMLGHLDESLDRYEQALRLYEAAFGPDHDETSRCMHGYAILCQIIGKLDDADRLLSRFLARARRQEAAGLRTGIQQTLDVLGRNHLLQMDYAGAEPLFREALASFEKYKPEHWRRFSVMSLLGGALLGQKKYA